MRFPCRHSICSYLLGTNTSSDYLVRNYMLQTYTDTSAPYNYIIPDHNMALRAHDCASSFLARMRMVFV